MDKQRALSLIRTQSESLAKITSAHDNPPFDKWYRDTRVVLENVFGAGSGQVREFESISFSLPVVIPYGAHPSVGERLRHEGFAGGKSRALSFLQSVLGEIEEFAEDSAAAVDHAVDPLANVLSLCQRFHLVARQLQARHDNRPTIEIEDEYDVQDLLHALLKTDIDDIRAEEWTPSYAGKSARMDFLLKDCQIVVEAKKTRKGLGEKEVGDELLVDIARYKTHPDCKILVCFIYDPEGKIGNPAGLENDLSGERDGLKVVTIVNPK
jgi:hypothetical protein